MVRRVAECLGLLSIICPLGGALRSRLSPESSAEIQTIQSYSFADFVVKFNRSYKEDTAEWQKREQLFEQSRQKVLDLQNRPKKWKAGVTKFMDYTQQEYSNMLGYTGRHGQDHLYKQSEVHNNAQIPENVDARGTVFKDLIHDQGMCGSCWAVAATHVLEGMCDATPSCINALRTKAGLPIPQLSAQSLVSCTSNPRNCGGSGGCAGATAELAFQLVVDRGMPIDQVLPYSQNTYFGSSEACDNPSVDDAFQNVALRIGGFEVLPMNEANPLKSALATLGYPIAVSVDASQWSLYLSGIFDSCGDSWTVNHAVTLVAYQENTKTEQGYWMIKNSWGDSFGEAGYMRIEMTANEDANCGMDMDTHVGLACDGDPNTAQVCGSCGILYDSSYPVGPSISQ